MADKLHLEPGPNHPITINTGHERVVVTVAGKVIADTRNALTLQEASYPPVRYIPVADVEAEALQRSDTTTYCPYKGDASYYSIPAGGAGAVDAVWEYRDPRPAVAAIKDHVAFYPDRVDSLDIEADGDRDVDQREGRCAVELILGSHDGVVVADNLDVHRYELRVSGEPVGTLDYRVLGRRRVLGHTEVLESHRGQGLSTVLIKSVLDRLLSDHTPITNYCPVVKTYIERHPQYLQIVDKQHPGNISLPEATGPSAS